MTRNGRKQKAPAFQFYPGDFLASDAVACMTNAEVGVYIKLLCRAWQGFGLPVEVERLARLAGEDVEAFQRMWDGPLGEQWEERDGKLFNPRMEDERQVQAEHRDARAEAGRRGAEARWNGKRMANACDRNGTRDGSAIDVPMANDGPLPIPSHPNPTETQSGANAPGAAPPKKPRRDSKAELRTAISAWEVQHGQMRPAVVDQIERYRALRSSKRWPVWDARSWSDTFDEAEGSQEALEAAFKKAAASKWQSVHPAKHVPRIDRGPARTRYQEAQLEREAQLKAMFDSEGPPDANGQQKRLESA